MSSNEEESEIFLNGTNSSSPKTHITTHNRNKSIRQQRTSLEALVLDDETQTYFLIVLVNQSSEILSSNEKRIQNLQQQIQELLEEYNVRTTERFHTLGT